MSTKTDPQPLQGRSFSEWLAHPAGLQSGESLSLEDIDQQLRAAFDVKADWYETMVLCVETLVKRGLRPMLPNDDTGVWEWTERFHGVEDYNDTPMGIAEGTIASWVAFGNSGGAEDLRFGIVLPNRPFIKPGRK